MAANPIEETIAKLEGLLSKSTPGPWRADDAFQVAGHALRVAMPDYHGFFGATVAEARHNWDDSANESRRISWAEAEANAALIAEARAALPTLISAYRDMEKQRDEANKQINELIGLATEARFEIEALSETQEN